jgi:hypothetical protein
LLARLATPLLLLLLVLWRPGSTSTLCRMGLGFCVLPILLLLETAVAANTVLLLSMLYRPEAEVIVLLLVLPLLLPISTVDSVALMTKPSPLPPLLLRVRGIGAIHTPPLPPPPPPPLPLLLLLRPLICVRAAASTTALTPTLLPGIAGSRSVAWVVPPLLVKIALLLIRPAGRLPRLSLLLSEALSLLKPALGLRGAVGGDSMRLLGLFGAERGAVFIVRGLGALPGALPAGVLPLLLGRAEEVRRSPMDFRELRG